MSTQEEAGRKSIESIRAVEYTPGSQLDELDQRVQQLVSIYGEEGGSTFDDNQRVVWEDPETKMRCSLELIFSYHSVEAWTEVRLQQLPKDDEDGWERLFVFYSKGPRGQCTPFAEVRHGEGMQWHGGWRAKKQTHIAPPTEYDLMELDIYLTLLERDESRAPTHSSRQMASLELGRWAMQTKELETNEFEFFKDAVNN